ncbi:MAG: hypothetical protein ACRD2L_06925, partial [Terriglobia bacterium]
SAHWKVSRTWLLAAAVLLVALVSLTTLNRRKTPELAQKPPAQTEKRQEILARLAVVETAPPYIPSTMRGGKTQAATERFQEGMLRYIEQDYTGAIGLLRESVSLNAGLQPALFYLGISQLMTDQPDEAIASLSRLTRIEASPYLEESHWFLAKAYLKKKQLLAAQRELESVVTLNGAHRQEARRALDLIQGLESSQGTPTQ